MALVVSLSQGVLANLLALQTTTNQINTVQNQLATGKKVNSALDNPTNFFLANNFQNSVNTLSTLLDGINIGQRTLDAANNGITSLTNLLNSAKGTLNQALASAATTGTLTTNTGTSLNSSRTAFAAQYDALRAQIDQQAIDSGYNGVSLLNNQSLAVITNVTATAKVILTGSNDTSAGLGVTASTNSFQD